MYAPDCVCESIAEIFNHITSDGDCPKEIIHGILVTLKTHGKQRGPASNLRPIILLSMKMVVERTTNARNETLHLVLL